MVVQVGVIAPEYFHDTADHRVTDQVGCKDLPIEFLTPEQPRQKKIEAEVQTGIVDFGGMDRNTMSFVAFRELDRPGNVRRLAITTPVKQATDAAEHAAQGDAGRQ